MLLCTRAQPELLGVGAAAADAPFVCRIGLCRRHPAGAAARADRLGATSRLPRHIGRAGRRAQQHADARGRPASRQLRPQRHARPAQARRRPARQHVQRKCAVRTTPQPTAARLWRALRRSALHRGRAAVRRGRGDAELAGEGRRVAAHAAARGLGPRGECAGAAPGVRCAATEPAREAVGG